MTSFNDRRTEGEQRQSPSPSPPSLTLWFPWSPGPSPVFGRDPHGSPLTLPSPPLSLQLIIPHLRYTMEINFRARAGLVSDLGVFDQVQEGRGLLGPILPRARPGGPQFP